MANMEETVKKNITSLLISTPMAMKMEQLAKDYRNIIGEWIPFKKMGYNSLEHFLRTITDTVVVNGGGPLAEVIPVIKDKSAHINKLVTNQKISIPKKKKSYQTPYVAKRKMFYPQPPRFSSSRVSGNSSGNTHLQHHNYDKSSNDQIHKLLNNMRISNTNFPLNPPANPPINFNRNLETKNVQNGNKPNYNVEGNSDGWKMNTRNAFNDDAAGTKNIQKINTRNTSNKDLEETIHAWNVNSRNKLNYDVEVSLSNSQWNSSHLSKVKKGLMEKHKPKINDSDTGVPLDIQNNLKRLIERYPEGIWCAKLPQMYRQLFYKELKYEMLGFTTLSQLCTSLPSIFHFVRPEKGDFKLYDRNKPLPKNVETSFTLASYSKKNNSEGGGSNALPNISWEDVINLLPEGTFKPGKEIPRTFISTETKVNDNIDIVVGEIYDLSKFWVYLNDGMLDQLMDDMQIFYSNHANEYLMPETLIRVGIYCVQVIFGEYHRALIVDTLPDVEGSIKVIFFDYGTMTKVSTEGLCFLHNKFADLEAQAIRCRLANICPPEEGSPWNVAASKAFRTMVNERNLCAKITHINREEQFIEIYLADVTDQKNICYINDRLVEEGHAQYPDKVLKRSMVHALCTPIVKYLHLFPTFLELEYGVVPSTSEMEVLADCNVPINFCYPQYFTTDQSDEIKRFKHVEEFFDSYLKGKRNNASHYIDLTNFKPAELNTSIFKDLESEIVACLNDIDLNNCDSVDGFSDLVDVSTDKECNIATTLRQLNELKTQTALELRRDYELSKEIINDIDLLSSGDDVYKLDNDILWTRNENDNSASALINSDKVSDDDGEDFLEVHPLSKMSFDERDSTNSSDCELENEDVNSKVLDECSDHGSGVEDEFYFLKQPDSYCSDSGSTGMNTNPFLADSDEAKGSIGQEVLVASTLNANNPFLKFLTGDDVPEFSPSDNVSEKSSTSTVYESYLQEKETCSKEDNKSNDVCVTEAVSSYSSLTDSVKMSRTGGSCTFSTRTSEDGPNSSRKIPGQSIPPPISMAAHQPYTNWSTGGQYFGAFDPRYTGASNPYPQLDYNMHQQMYRYGYGPMYPPHPSMGMQNRPMQGVPMEMQNGPMRMMQGGPVLNGPMGFHAPRGPPPQVSGICPPPGFAPNSNIYQRGLPNFPQQQQPGIPMYPTQSPMVPQQQRDVPLQYNTVSGRPTTSSSTLVNNNKDFYEAYNDMLMQKIQAKRD